MKNREQPVRAVDEYLRLPYTVEIRRDEGVSSSGWFARVRELPGCMTQAERFEELGPMIEDAMRAWIETALEDGQPVSEPQKQIEYSGKFVLRVPRTLHRQLAERAETEGVSLNQLCSMLLAQALGTAHSTFAPSKRIEQHRRKPAYATSVAAIQEQQSPYEAETDNA